MRRNSPQIVAEGVVQALPRLHNVHEIATGAAPRPLMLAGSA
jgi:hypothetical protein